jgi:hypothetical protein
MMSVVSPPAVAAIIADDDSTDGRQAQNTQALLRETRSFG